MVAPALLVASIGAADSLNPSTIGPALVFATGRRPVRALASFTAGVFLTSFAAGVLVVLGPGQLLIDSLPEPSAHAKNVVEVVAGALLLLLAAVLWARRGRVSGRIAESRSEDTDRSAFLLGAGIIAVELPTAFPYFAALATIVAAHVSLGAGIALVALFNLAFVSPLLAILAVRALAGERAAAVLERAGAWFDRRAGAILALLLGVVGAGVLIVGVAGLT
jgi:cytochrome c biogenesis protein CcdA